MRFPRTPDRKLFTELHLFLQQVQPLEFLFFSGLIVDDDLCRSQQFSLHNQNDCNPGKGYYPHTKKIHDRNDQRKYLVCPSSGKVRVRLSKFKVGDPLPEREKSRHKIEPDCLVRCGYRCCFGNEMPSLIDKGKMINEEQKPQNRINNQTDIKQNCQILQLFC